MSECSGAICHSFIADRENGKKENLDPNTFRFWTDEYNCVGDNVFECNDPDGNGKWTYDPTTQEAIFLPKKGFKGEVTIMYDIKSKALLNDDKYRSSLAKIILKIDDNQPQ